MEWLNERIEALSKRREINVMAERERGQGEGERYESETGRERRE